MTDVAGSQDWVIAGTGWNAGGYFVVKFVPETDARPPRLMVERWSTDSEGVLEQRARIAVPVPCSATLRSMGEAFAAAAELVE